MTHALALALTAGLSTFLFVPRSTPQPLVTAAPAIQIALEAQALPPAPPVQQPPQEAKPILRREHKQAQAPPLMAAIVATPADYSPAPDSPPAPPNDPPPSPKTANSGSLDAQYAATLRTNIDSRTNAPSSAEYRLLKPHGEVRVSFTLDRSGSMLESQVARSSGSTLLDRHALSIVQAGRYPPFPGDAFRDETHHTFLITLEFHS